MRFVDIAGGSGGGSATLNTPGHYAQDRLTNQRQEIKT